MKKIIITLFLFLTNCEQIQEENSSEQIEDLTWDCQQTPCFKEFLNLRPQNNWDIQIFEEEFDLWASCHIDYINNQHPNYCYFSDDKFCNQDYYNYLMQQKESYQNLEQYYNFLITKSNFEFIFFESTQEAINFCEKNI